MENEAITLELESSSASKKASAHIDQVNQANDASSLSYIPGTMQSMVDELLAEMLQMDDPFEQMNFIILKLMPAVLAEQEQSIETIAPLIESNKVYNERLAGIQGEFAKWESIDPQQNGFFDEVEELGTALEADPTYGVQEQMLESVNRIAANAEEITAGTSLTAEKAAWNSVNAPYSAYNNQVSFESYPIESVSTASFDKALNNTSRFQPFLDQTGQELEILKGLNVNMAKQMELDLKYKVEFYNSYVTSIGSMEDNTSKQRRTAVDRLKS